MRTCSMSSMKVVSSPVVSAFFQKPEDPFEPLTVAACRNPPTGAHIDEDIGNANDVVRKHKDFFPRLLWKWRWR